MTEAERVLAVVAGLIRHHGRDGAMLDVRKLETLTAPYLPKPEPDRLTVAAGECLSTLVAGRGVVWSAQVSRVRAIIAREVAAAEPSDEVLRKFENAASLFSQLRTTVAVRFDGLCERELWLSINAAFDKLEAARAALRGKAHD